MIGASAFTWEIQHVLGHHPYTNLMSVKNELMKQTEGDEEEEEEEEGLEHFKFSQESDPDVFSSFPFMRMHPSHPRKWYHSYQYIYGPILFSMMTLSKVFQQDYDMFTHKRLYHISAASRYGTKNYKNFSNVINCIRFILMKVITIGYMLILPIYTQGLMFGSFLFTLGHLICGEMLATMFIVNHVIDGVAFVIDGNHGVHHQQKKDIGVKETTKMSPTTIHGQTYSQPTKGVPSNDWAAVQCQTSVNWSSGSWFWNHFSGGLNHQIEHHLFPSICHTNYVHIQNIVEKTCNEFNVPYRSENSLYSAYWKMIQHLKTMGTMDTNESFYVPELSQKKEN